MTKSDCRPVCFRLMSADYLSARTIYLPVPTKRFLFLNIRASISMHLNLLFLVESNFFSVALLSLQMDFVPHRCDR